MSNRVYIVTEGSTNMPSMDYLAAESPCADQHPHPAHYWGDETAAMVMVCRGRAEGW